MKNYSHPPPISARASLALDALRLLAAAVVVVFHVSSQWMTGYAALHDALGKASHAAVVVFFVLSGYVIVFSTAANNRGPRQYAVARLSRLYSMLLPALLLTATVEAVVTRYDAQLTARYVHAHSGLRYLLTAFFLNESGPLSAAPPLDSPLWSLSYEWWYYVLFGLWFYRALVPRFSWWLAGAALLAGPKILLMLPVWLFGAAAWWLRKQHAGLWPAWLRMAGLLLLAGVGVAYLPALPGAVGNRPLFMSGQFATDWVIGALVGGALWCLPTGRPAAARPWTKSFRQLADLSFPLYVFHFPLIVLWRLAVGWRVNDWAQMAQVMLGVTLVAGLLGVAFERQRRGWVRLFERLSRLFYPGGALPGK
jgi:peptidoglycan/LPS O-acetylase OafA/YrhL